MRPLPLCAATALLLTATAACSPARPPVVRGALDCPAAQGELRRVSIAPDQKSCVYTTNGGDEISLRLIAFAGTPAAALEPIRRELDAQRAEPAPPAKSDAERAAREAAHDAKVSETGAKAGDDSAKIDLPGVHINADDSGGKIDVGPIHIDAADDHVEISQQPHKVRMRGEALSFERRGFRATYALANSELKDGYKAIGYEAGGPLTGPMAVAVVRARAGAHDSLVKDVQRLVRRNGGV